MIIIFISLCLYQSVHGATQTACTKTDTTRASIPLNCSSNQMIHVIRELYGERTSEGDCRVVRVNSNSRAYPSDKEGLVVICNGHKTCIEKTACGVHCNGTGKAFEITYECVNESENICSPLHQTSSLSSLYLHSPGFPYSAEEKGSCECSVSGADLEVMVIQYRGKAGGLQINTTGDDSKTWTSVVNTFNRNIASNVNKVITSFTKEGQSDTRIWVRIKGNISYISCTSTLSTTTTTTTASEEITDSIETTTKSASSSETYPTDSNGITTELTSTGSDTSTNISTLNNIDYVGSSTEAVTSTTTDDRLSPQSTGESMAQENNRGDRGLILISGTVSGGVFLLILLIVITVCVCRRRKRNMQTIKKDSNIQLPLEHNERNGVIISKQLETRSNEYTTNSRKFCSAPNSSISRGTVQGSNHQENNTSMYENKTFDEQVSVDEEDGMVDNDLYHRYNTQIYDTDMSKKQEVDTLSTQCVENEEQEADSDQEIQMVANDLYHSYQPVDTTPQTYPHVNAKDAAVVAAGASGVVAIDATGAADDATVAVAADDEEEKEKMTSMNDLYHTLESETTIDGLSPDIDDGADENVMVTNDLYHSYRNPEIHQDIETREEIVMEDNDLYHTRNTAVVRDTENHYDTLNDDTIDMTDT